MAITLHAPVKSTNFSGPNIQRPYFEKIDSSSVAAQFIISFAWNEWAVISFSNQQL